MHLGLVLALVALSSGAVAAATESDGEDVAASVTARQARALRGRERWRNSTHFGASACALAHAPLLHIGSHVPQDDVPASESDGEDEPGMDRHRVRLQRVNLPQPRLRTLAGASTVGAAAGCGAGSCAVLGMTHVRLVGPSHGMTSPPTLLRVRGGFGPRWPFKRDEEEDGEAEERGRDKKAKDKEQRKRKDDDDETVSEDSHKEKEREKEREREREKKRDKAREEGERDKARPKRDGDWWHRLGTAARGSPHGKEGADAKRDATDREDRAEGPSRAPPGVLPTGFVALDPAVLHKIREMQRSRERDTKARQSKGPASWFRRLLRFGIALATLQPVAVTLVLNVIKLMLLLRRVVGGALELDVEDGYKTSEVQSNTTFADVVGVDEAKTELQDIVAYLKDPAKFTRLGGKMAKGVLLWGPPGTGKTLLARAIAGEAGVPFRYAAGSEFEEMYVGVGARRVRDLFQQAKSQLPCIVFLDEIDAIGSSRSMTDQQSLRQTLNQILTELDGFSASEGLIVIAATNFPEVLDKALTRPGRFDRHIEVANPDVKGREAILKVHSRNVTLAKEVDLHVIARGTPGLSGAELASLINKAACSAAQKNKLAVGMTDLEEAKDLILMGGKRSAQAFSDENRKLTAFHEGGHALVACLTDGALPVHKATIVPRGQALGMVMQLPDEDMTSWSQRQMLAEMDVCMGGRAAEELIFGVDNITSGASSDLERATAIASSMVEKFGMSRAVGMVSHGKAGSRRGRAGAATSVISDNTKATIDTEVRRLTQESYQRAYMMLKQNKRTLDAIAAALMSDETLTGQQIRDIVAESAADKGILGSLRLWLLGNKRDTDSKSSEQVKDVQARLNAVEEQVQDLGKVAATLAELAAKMQAQAPSAA